MSVGRGQRGRSRLGVMEQSMCFMLRAATGCPQRVLEEE